MHIIRKKCRYVASASAARRRRGVATLEFAMTLPILMIVMVTVIWFGVAMFKQADVTVQARNQAWRARYKNPPGTPFRFRQASLVNGSAKREVGVSPLFNGFGAANSRHSVMAGAWDHRQVGYQFGERHPNWQLMTRLGEAVVRGRIGDAVRSLKNTLWNFKLGYGLLTNALSGKIGQLNGKLSSAQSAIGNKREEEKRKAEKAKKGVKKLIETNKKEIRNLKREIDELRMEKVRLMKELEADAKKKKDDPTKLKPKQRKKKEDRIKNGIPDSITKKNRAVSTLESEIRKSREYLRNAN